jgi:hypothetical protein
LIRARSVILRGHSVAILSLLSYLVFVTFTASGETSKSAQWRPATADELRSVIPVRAPVISERIETEFRTASAITDGKGKFVAGVVLITAGYSADGKYSHFFLTQIPLRVGNFSLSPGQYLVGWARHDNDTLLISFYHASTGVPVGQIIASRNENIHRVESFRVWPPDTRSVIQIGRFTFSYTVEAN